jgi:membrane associated rhomboid family serine protease
MRHDGRVPAVLSLLYVVLLVTAGTTGGRLLRARVPVVARRVPVATAVAFTLTVVPSLLQLTLAPGLFETLRRDRAEIAGGQVWRLVTSFAVQDSGWPGLIFNLIALAVIGTLAERLWGPGRWIAVALTAQLLGSLWGLAVQPVGAGTSLVNFGLAGALAAAALLRGAAVTRALGGAVLIAALTLLALADIHGGAALTGALFAVLFLRDD